MDPSTLAACIATFIKSTRPPVPAAEHQLQDAVNEFNQAFFFKTIVGRRSLDTQEHRVQLDMLVANEDSIEAMRRSNELIDFQNKWGVDVILQHDTVYRKHKRLVVFDMDSTLIEQEVIDEIAAYVGVKDQVAAITERAMNGELDFSASLRARAALLKGVPSTVFESLKSTITFTPGARDLCKCLKRLGCKMAVLSGGFIPLASWVKDELGLDYAYANSLGVSEDGKTLSGEVVGEIVNAERKQTLLEEIARKEGVHLKQVVAIGDGANDLLMMKSAGLGIAFNAKHAVQLAAPARLNSPTLMDALYVFGFTAKEQQELLETI